MQANSKPLLFQLLTRPPPVARLSSDSQPAPSLPYSQHLLFRMAQTIKTHRIPTFHLNLLSQPTGQLPSLQSHTNVLTLHFRAALQHQRACPLTWLAKHRPLLLPVHSLCWHLHHAQRVHHYPYCQGISLRILGRFSCRYQKCLSSLWRRSECAFFNCFQRPQHYQGGGNPNHSL